MSPTCHLVWQRPKSFQSSVQSGDLQHSETLSNTFTPSLPDPFSINFPLHPVLPQLSRLPPSHLPTKDLDLL